METINWVEVVNFVAAFISAVVTLIAVIVSVFTLANSARKDSFEQLRVVVDELKEQLKVSNDENQRLRAELDDREKQIDEMSKRIDAQDELIATLQAQIGKDSQFPKGE